MFWDVSCSTQGLGRTFSYATAPFILWKSISFVSGLGFPGNRALDSDLGRVYPYFVRWSEQEWGRGSMCTTETPSSRHLPLLAEPAEQWPHFCLSSFLPPPIFEVPFYLFPLFLKILSCFTCFSLISHLFRISLLEIISLFLPVLLPHPQLILLFSFGRQSKAVGDSTPWVPPSQMRVWKLGRHGEDLGVLPPSWDP